MSQLALAFSSGVSCRHISFIENGRAHPSREVLLRLTHALNLTRSQKNRLLVAAGYIPDLRNLPPEHTDSMALRRAFGIIIRNQTPYPAYAIDRAWNVVMSNEPFTRLISWIAGDLETLSKPLNTIRLILHPDQLRPYVLNWQEAAQVLWNRVRADLQVPHSPDEARTLFQEINGYPGIRDIVDEASPPEDGLLLPIKFRRAGRRMSWFCITSSLGSPPQLSTYQLRLEAMFPADQETAVAMRRLMECDDPTD